MRGDGRPGAANSFLMAGFFFYNRSSLAISPSPSSVSLFRLGFPVFKSQSMAAKYSLTSVSSSTVTPDELPHHCFIERFIS
jgi:hypothetical protein